MPAFCRRIFPAIIFLTATFSLVGCATNDNPPCRRVNAAEFMRPHTFKGIASDQFIGITHTGMPHHHSGTPDKAFKTIWQMGLFSGWAVIWCPANELPTDYLKSAATNPNRKPPGVTDFVHP